MNTHVVLETQIWANFGVSEKLKRDIFLGETVIGTFYIEPDKSYPTYMEFSCFFIYEDFQNKGYGKQFMLKMIESLKHITLNCANNNTIALKLYHSVGFKKVATDSDWYSKYIL